MILVKSIEMEYVQGREARLALMPKFPSVHKENSPVEIESMDELVEAQVFINSKGEEVIVGISKEAQKALGMPMAALRDMSNTINELRSQIYRYQKDFILITKKQNDVIFDLDMAERRKEAVENAGLLKRIGFVFTGVKV